MVSLAFLFRQKVYRRLDFLGWRSCRILLHLPDGVLTDHHNLAMAVSQCHQSAIDDTERPPGGTLQVLLLLQNGQYVNTGSGLDDSS